MYKENTTRYIKYASTAMVQTAETHGISDVEEKGTKMLRKFNTRLVPNITSVPGLLVTIIPFKPYKSAIFKQEVFFIITDIYRDDFSYQVHKMLKELNNWFDNNLLKLNFHKTYYMEFKTRKQLNHNTQVLNNTNYIINSQ